MIPLWLKLAYTAFVAVLVPVYAVHYGPGNFLWFSDVALVLGLAAVWLEQPLLAGTQAIAVVVPESVWALEVVVRAALDVRLFGLTDYMFDSSIPPFVRALSLFHLWLPVLLVWLVFRLGYDRRSFGVQIVIGSVVLVATYVLTGADRNVNWVHRWGTLTGGWPLALSLVVFPVVFYLPAHLVLRAKAPVPRPR